MPFCVYLEGPFFSSHAGCMALVSPCFPPSLYLPSLSPAWFSFFHSKGPKASNSPLVGFCRETPRGPNSWFHVFPPHPNSRGFTSKDVIRLQKRSTDTYTHIHTHLWYAALEPLPAHTQHRTRTHIHIHIHTHTLTYTHTYGTRP